MKQGVKKKPSPLNQAANSKLLFGMVGAGILAFVFLMTTVMFFKQTRQAQVNLAHTSNELQELKKPKYDEKLDLLTEQCEKDNIACVSTTTRTPSIEILKFLVNFKQYEGTQYRLFLEIQHTSEVVTTPFQYKCDAGNKAFYVCQEISATHPADVLRVFERSYATLSPNATYQFNLMVKPVSDQVSADPIRMKPNNNLVVLGADGKIVSGTETEYNQQSDVKPQPVQAETQQVAEANDVAEQPIENVAEGQIQQ